MPFFECKQELFSIICLLLVPAATCFGFYKKFPKLVWISPLVIILLSVVISFIFYPYLLDDILGNKYDYTTTTWLMIYMPVQVVSALLATFITYIVIKLKKDKDPID